MKIKRINWIAVLAVIAIILAVLYFSGTFNMEQLEQETPTPELKAEETPKVLETPTTQAPTTEAPKAEDKDKVLSSDELLPKLSEQADDFVKQNPVAQMLKEQNFLVSGYHVGINTVLQSSKIPYYDLRSSPAISKTMVSPWLNSSIEAPAGSSTRRLFEIGSA